ncbi:MAG: carbohydrate binding family 9 domain-containing protein [Cytophagales bacterium]|nr:carbohydrate binding family 9 domain-containing protein [Cytophagales bacterium]
MKKTGLILAFGLFSWTLYGQKINGSYVIHIKKAKEPIMIDGQLNEPDWQTAHAAKDFFMVLPMDTSRSVSRTEVRMTYDATNIYLGVICFDTLSGRVTVESMRRDFSFGKNDNFLLFMDPFDDQTNGFSFGSNAAGAQWDGLMYDGSRVDLSWDNKWVSMVRNYDDRWVFEASIPFKTIRYKKGITQWGINFSRLDLKLNEKSSWAPVPRQFPTAQLAYTGILQWDEPPPEVNSNVSVIPYLSAGAQKDFESQSGTDHDFDMGLDAKLAVTTSLNLDLTVNPDFSQVEVDRQVTNLSRFELFFPERRQFFIENSDLFANFGFTSMRPFFSRRIGLESPIHAGVRLSGKINKDWRIGVMDIQTGKVDSVALPAQNFSVISLQRQVFSRSNISAMIINKQAVNYDPENDTTAFSRYNRLAALEYNLASPDNLWKGKFLLHKTFSEDTRSDDFAHGVNLEYNSRNINVEWQHEMVGENFNPEVGFVPRRGYIKLNPEVAYRFFPDSRRVITHGPAIRSTLFFDQSFDFLDRTSFLEYNINFINRSEATFWIRDDFITLIDDFDPTNSGGEELPAGTSYQWHTAGLAYESTPGNLFTYSLEITQGGYFDGSRFNASGAAGYRIQPFGNLTLDFSYNSIRLPDPYEDADFWLVGPRIDMTFTNKIFLTTFVQYNEQQDNLNINARFQWRYKPASDLFVVYTDNYLPQSLKVRNRALVLKLTYWWNI